MNAKLDIWKTVKESFVVSVDSFIKSLQVGGPVLVLAFALMAATSFSGNPAIRKAGFAVYMLAAFCAFAAVTLVSQTKAIGVELPSSFVGIVTKSRFWKYLGASLLVVLLPAAVAMATVVLVAAMAFEGMTGLQETIAVLTLAAGIIAGVYLAFRLMLVTPAIAAGKPFSLVASWRNAKGNVLSIAMSLFLCLLPVSIVQSSLETIAKYATSTELVVAVALCVLLTAMIQCILAGAVTGIAYREVMRHCNGVVGFHDLAGDLIED